MKKLSLITIIICALCGLRAEAVELPAAAVDSTMPITGVEPLVRDSAATLVDETFVTRGPAIPPQRPELNIDSEMPGRRHKWVSPYTLPYTPHAVNPDWHRMWINTAVLSGAFVGTLFVLEMLPDDATAWNRESIQQTPLFQRWWSNIFVHNPEVDHDNPVFNYILHPYAGAAYFMSARSCGFSFWGSFLYSFAISTIEWEFGIEAFMERPSYQDILITPIAGSLLGELCYMGKHAIVQQGYTLLGSYFLGRFASFVLDPVNEVIDLFRGNPAAPYARSRREGRRGVSSTFVPRPDGFSLVVNF